MRLFQEKIFPLFLIDSPPLVWYNGFNTKKGGDRITLSKLAQLANVSVSVVSKAFSGRPDISDAMREHVFAVARAHGCFQQFYHVPYDKPVIAVILPEVISQYYIRYIEVLGKLFEKSGYTMLLSISNFDRQLTSELVRYYTEHSKVDGLLLLSHPDALPAASPTTIVSMYCEEGLPHVSADLSTGLRAALLHLRECGHTRIGYIGEEFTLTNQQLFCTVCDELGLEVRPEWMLSSRYRFEKAGEDGVERIWRSGKQTPTALFGAYSYITRGILSALRARDIKIPEEVSVISMNSDSAPLDAVLDVACIPSEIERCCEAAVTLLGERLGKKTAASPVGVTIPTAFSPGETVKRI